MESTSLRFEDLGLIDQLVSAVHAEGYENPTPIQQQAIPHVLAGKDLLGLAQTGTGKTAAFALPILQRLHEKGYRPHGDRPIKVLVLTPTRELASQIGESFRVYGKNLGYKHTVIFGGVGQRDQERALRSGIDILVATPGRLLDLASQRLVHFQNLDLFVLDEADRMLDMGFIHDVRKVIALIPKQRQTLFFSATMPPEAQKLADMLLKDPATVAVTPVSSTVERIDQSVYFVDKNDKRKLLVEVLGDKAMKRVLVFSRTKHGANRIAEHLEKNRVDAAAIHGNKSQNARERALEGFKRGTTRVLVATDIAARGIDIDEITHVVNFDLPDVPETYVHRIGRTGRAGASGIAITFCDREERADLSAVERLIRKTIPVVTGHPYAPGANRGPREDDDRDERRGSGRHEQRRRDDRPRREPPRPSPPRGQQPPHRAPAPGSAPAHKPAPPRDDFGTTWNEDGEPVAAKAPAPGRHPAPRPSPQGHPPGPGGGGRRRRGGRGGRGGGGGRPAGPPR
jgi:ATP-dependent RNA helicase RhlE